MDNLFKKFFDFGFVEIFSRGINWIILPVLAFLIDQAKYGQIALLYTLIVTMSSIAIFGQGRAILKLYDYAHPNKIQACFIVILLASILTIPVSAYVDPDLYILVFFVVLINCLHTGTSAAARATHDLRRFFKLRASLVFLRLILIFSSVFIGESIEWYLIAELIAPIFSLSIAGYGRKKLGTIKRFDIRNLREPVFIGFPMFLTAVNAVLISHYDKILLVKEIEMSLLGNYFFMSSLAASIAFVTAFHAIKYESSIYQSAFVNEAVNKTKLFIKKCVGGYILIFPALLLVIYSTKLTDTGPNIDFKVFLMLLVGNCFMGCSAGYTYLMTYFGKTRYVYYCSVAVAIISIGANNIMIPKFQIFGAGLTILMSGIIGFLINAMVARKLLSLEHVRNNVAGAKDK